MRSERRGPRERRDGNSCQRDGKFRAHYRNHDDHVVRGQYGRIARRGAVRGRIDAHAQRDESHFAKRGEHSDGGQRHGHVHRGRRKQLAMRQLREGERAEHRRFGERERIDGRYGRRYERGLRPGIRRERNGKPKSQTLCMEGIGRGSLSRNGNKQVCNSSATKDGNEEHRRIPTIAKRINYLHGDGIRNRYSNDRMNVVIFVSTILLRLRILQSCNDEHENHAQSDVRSTRMSYHVHVNFVSGSRRSSMDCI